MESTSSKRRDIIKNITIIFLIIMLLLTFFSTTILNHSLPEVAAQYAYGGQITTSVRTNGVTQANENYQVIIEEGRTIQSINVRRGDTVEAGDILFLLEDKESTELQAAIDKLTEAKKSYDKWKLDKEAAIVDQELQIQYAEEDLAKTKAKGVSKVDTSALEAKIKSLTKELASYSLSHAQLAYDTAKKAVDAAQTAVDNADKNAEAKQLLIEEKENARDIKNEKKTDLQEVLQEAQEILSNLKQNSSESVQSQIKNAERNLEDMRIARSRAQDEMNTIVTERDGAIAKRDELQKTLNRAKIDYNDALGKKAINEEELKYWQNLATDPLVSADERENASLQAARCTTLQAELNESVSYYNGKLMEAQTAFDNNEKTIETCEESIKTKQLDLDDKDRSISRSEEDLAILKKGLDGVVSAADIEKQEAVVEAAEDAVKAAEKEIKEAEKEITAATKEKNNAQEALAEKQNDLNSAKTELNSAKADLDAAKKGTRADGKTYTEEQIAKLIEETELKLADAQEQLKDLQDQSSEGYPTQEAYNEAVTTATRRVTELKTALSRAKENNKLDEPSYVETISRAQKEVERLTESVGAPVIKAKVGGKINNIMVTAGQKVEAQTTLLDIEQLDKGYSVELSLTVEQAKRIAVGQSATILYYWGSTPEAVVESIKADKNDPQNKRIVTLRLTGDITAGQSFTFSLGEKSQTYDAVIPNSAIREDSSGKFVLVVNAKSTPVGNRYTAQRVDVDVIASDETNTAVSGLLGGEFVITSSTTPIAAGQQVRLANN